MKMKFKINDIVLIMLVLNFKASFIILNVRQNLEGKFKKNYTNITIIAKDMGSKHKLEGTIEDNKIFLTFSSTHEEANLRYGGCTFILAKD